MSKVWPPSVAWPVGTVEYDPLSKAVAAVPRGTGASFAWAKTLEAAIKLEARMSPVVDLVKRAAFMGPTVSSVPYAQSDVDLALRHGPAKGPSPFRLERYREGFNGGGNKLRPQLPSGFWFLRRGARG